MKFKIAIFQFYGKSEHKQEKRNKIRQFFHGTCSNPSLHFLGHIMPKHFIDF